MLDPSPVMQTAISMATKVVPLVLASLIHFFYWSLPHGYDPKKLDMSKKFGVTLKKEQPLYFNLVSDNKHVVYVIWVICY